MAKRERVLKIPPGYRELPAGEPLPPPKSMTRQEEEAEMRDHPERCEAYLWNLIARSRRKPPERCVNSWKRYGVSGQ
jgi:hypothetical protein